jgi:hypothetical protein
MNSEPNVGLETERPFFDVGGMLFELRTAEGSLHAFGDTLNFAAPRQSSIELWLSPNYFESTKHQGSLWTIRLASHAFACHDGDVYVRARALDKDGTPAIIRKRVRGKIGLSFETSDVNSARVCLELHKSGAVTISRLSMRIRAHAPVEEPKATSNPLFDLVIEDFRQAEKNEAEIPKSRSDSILTYREP